MAHGFILARIGTLPILETNFNRSIGPLSISQCLSMINYHSKFKNRKAPIDTSGQDFNIDIRVGPCVEYRQGHTNIYILIECSVFHLHAHHLFILTLLLMSLSAIVSRPSGVVVGGDRMSNKLKVVY